MLPLLEGEEEDEDPPRYAYLLLDGKEVDAVMRGGRKLIRSRGNIEVYDVRTDAGETVDVAADQRIWAGYLLALLEYRDAFGAAAAETQEAELDDEARRTLEALGYLR